MAGINTLSSMKQMDRAKRLREENLSDDEFFAIIDEVVQNALVAQASGSRKMMKRASREMKQVRRDMVNKNIKSSSSRQRKVISRFGGIVDSIDEETESMKTQKGGVGQGIASALPSADTFLSALMTANPVLGYSTKIIKDIGGSVKQSKQANNEIVKRQMQQLEQARENLLAEFEGNEEQSELIEQEKETTGSYHDILKTIESEIRRLREIWDDTSETTQQQADNSDETKSHLSHLVRVENEILEEQRIRREKEEFDKIENMRESGKGSDLVRLDENGNPETEEEGGLMAALMGGLSGGLVAGITTVIGMFKSIGLAGLKLAGIGLRASGIGTIIMSIYHFVDGFFNAGDLLDIPEDQVNISDRLIAGFSNMWGKIIKLFDWILELFGIDLFNSEGMEKKIADKVMGIKDGVIQFFSDIVEDVKTFLKEFSISDVVDSVKKKANEMIQSIKDTIGDLFDGIKEFFLGEDDEFENSGSERFKRRGRDVGSGLNLDDDVVEEEESENSGVGRRRRRGGRGAIGSGTSKELEKLEAKTAAKEMTKASKEAETQLAKPAAGMPNLFAPYTSQTINQSTTVQTISNTSNPDPTFRYRGYDIFGFNFSKN